MLLRRVQQGFTIIELIVALVVLAVISTGTIRYITSTTEGYMLASRIMSLTSAGRSVLARITREVRTSVPNSARVGEQFCHPRDAGNCVNRCIEFLPMAESTSFLDLGNVDDAGVVEAKIFPSDDNEIPGVAECPLIDCSKFSVVKPVGFPFNPTPAYVAVAPDTPLDLYSGASRRMFPFCNIEARTQGATSTESLSIYDVEKGVWPGSCPGNAPAQLPFEEQPISQRIFFADSPVAYCIMDGETPNSSAGELRRFQGYPLTPTLVEPGLEFSAVMADGMTNLKGGTDPDLLDAGKTPDIAPIFDIFSNRNEDKAIFGARFMFEPTTDQPQLTLDHEIQVRNSP